MIKYTCRCSWCKEKMPAGSKLRTVGYYDRLLLNQRGYANWIPYPVKGRYCDDICANSDLFNKLIKSRQNREKYEHENSMRKLQKNEEKGSYDLDLHAFFNW